MRSFYTYCKSPDWDLLTEQTNSCSLQRAENLGKWPHSEIYLPDFDTKRKGSSLPRLSILAHVVMKPILQHTVIDSHRTGRQGVVRVHDQTLQRPEGECRGRARGRRRVQRGGGGVPVHLIGDMGLQVQSRLRYQHQLGLHGGPRRRSSGVGGAGVRHGVAKRGKEARAQGGDYREG